MNLNDQVCSFELSKKLTELGVVQQSLYGWSVYSSSDKLMQDECFITSSQAINLSIYNHKLNKFYSAFTISELLELLPAMITHGEPPFENNYLMIEKRSYKAHQYIVSYCCDSYATDNSYEHYGIKPFGTKIICKTYDEHLQNALAKMLIYLIENKLIGLK